MKGTVIENLENLFVFFALKEGVSLHSQQKVRFKEYFEYFLRDKNMKKKTIIRKVVRTLKLHINNCNKLLKN